MSFLPMTRLALKWAFRKPVTSRYPFEPRKMVPLSRGVLQFKPESCTYCTVCQRKCPTNAIVVDRVKKTWTIDRLACISCNCCVDICPKKSLGLTTEHCTPATDRGTETYGAGTLPPTPAEEAPKPAEAAAPAEKAVPAAVS